MAHIVPIRKPAGKAAPKKASWFRRIGAFARARAKHVHRASPIENTRRLSYANAAPLHPPMVMPRANEKGLAGIAADEAVAATWEWAANAGPFAGAFSEGVIFLGYAYLAELTQRPEYRLISEVIAEEMTREWIEFKTASGKDDKNDKIKRLEKAILGYKLKDLFKTVAEYDGYMGRAHLFVDLGDPETGESYETDSDELLTSIGNGRNKKSQSKVGKNSLIAFRHVEAMWVYPTRYGSFDPLAADWYNPTTWLVVGREVHCTRLLTFVGRPVPDMLKPAYSFGGLSSSQMAKPYVDNWLRTRQSVSDLITNFSVPVLMTLLGTSIQEGGEELFDRLGLFNDLRDNQGVMALDKETEDFKNVSAPLGTLDTLQAQTQEHLFSVSRIPAVKFTGIQPHGLNASSEGEIRSFYDTIAARQIRVLSTHLQTCIDFIQLSLWGEVDEDIVWEWKPLWQQDEAGESAIEKTKADIDDAYLAAGVIKPVEVRTRLAEDPKSIYRGLSLDPEDLPEQPDMGMGMPGEGGEEEGGLPPPKDKGNRLASSIVGKAAEFGGPDTGGYPAHDETIIECDGWFADAFDDAEFEAQHPRAPDGKFGEVGKMGFVEPKDQKTHPKHAVSSVLKAYGYKPSGQQNGVHLFEHENGHKVHIGAATTGQGGELGLTGFHANGVKGQGAGKLAKHLEQLHGAAPNPPPGKKKAEAVNGPVSLPLGAKVDSNFDPVMSSKDYDKLSDALSSASVESPPGEVIEGGEFGIGKTAGTILETDLTGKWSINDPDGKKKASGSTWASLYNHITENKEIEEKLAAAEHKFGLTESKPFAVPGHIAKQIKPETKQIGKANLGYPPSMQPGTSVHLKTGEILIMSSSTGDWELMKGGEVIAQGTGKEELNAEFELLHPRDASGKFVAKENLSIKDKGWKYNNYESDGPSHWYDAPDGKILLVNKEKGTWELFPDKHSSSTENGNLGNVPDAQGVATPKAIEHPDLAMQDVLNQIPGLEFTGMNGNIMNFKLPNGGQLGVLKTNNSASWSFKPQGGQYKVGTGAHSLKQKLATAGTPAASQPAVVTQPAVGNILDFAGMKKIGGQLGSNPGGQYEDNEGNKFYIKQPADNDHTKNELLAAALFGAAGGNTLKYHQVVDGSKLYVGTDWQNLKASNVSQLTSAQRAEARKDFALNAWLANWDVAGTGGDNIGVTDDGKVVPLDFGGSLLYRAKGAPKGGAFGSSVNEWNSLRDPSVNKDTAALYADMTESELKESAARVAGISDDKIREMVQQYGPGDVQARQALANKLIARKQDVSKQASTSGEPKPKSPDELRRHIATWNPDGKPASSITNYKGNDYKEMNALMRYSLLEDQDDSMAADDIRKIRNWLNKASSKEPLTLYRGYKSNILKEYSNFARPGRVLHDYGFMSMSTSKSFSDNWHGGTGFTIKIDVPVGSKIGTIRDKNQDDGEYEVLAQHGYVVRITKWDSQNKIYEGTLEKIVEKESF